MSPIALKVKAFLTFLATTALSNAIADCRKAYRAMRAIEKANDFEALQLAIVEWSKKTNKINKIRAALARANSQAIAIENALKFKALHGRYEVTVAQALEIIGDFSQPSKMPCFGYSLPAKIACHIGALLATIAGSVCSCCYACKGNYNYYEVKANLYRRLASIDHLDLWIHCMNIAIAYVYGGGRYKKSKKIADLRFFRYHDSGDVTSIAHFRAIVAIAQQNHGVTFWLPTKEMDIVKAYMAEGGIIPNNLVIRISAPMIGQTKPQALPLRASAVNSTDPMACHCPAPSQGGHCLTCRACWDPSVAIVSYHKH